MKKILITGLALMLVTGCSSGSSGQSAGGNTEPESEPVVYTLESAAAYMEEGNYALAIESYSALIDSDPDNYSLYIMRAQAYAMQKEYSSAVSDCTAAIGIDDANTEAYVFRGLLNYMNGSASDGEEDIRQAEYIVEGTDGAYDALLDQMTEYAGKLAVAVETDTETEGLAKTVFTMPDGTKAFIVQLTGSPFRITTIDAGDEIPEDVTGLLLTYFDWEAADDPVYVKFNEDSTVSIDFFGQPEEYPFYISAGDDVYPAGTVYIGAPSFYDEDTMYAAFFVADEDGTRYLLLCGVHFADEILLKAVLPK